MEKTGLVLEGGGHRGIYTAGVLDVLYENNVIVDGVIGVSAGAIHGASYCSGQTGRSINYTEKYCADKRYMGIKSFILTGDYFNVDFCYRKIPDVLVPFNNDALEKSPTAFYVTATNAQTGKPIYHRCKTLRGHEMDWLQGSASMPVVSRIVFTDSGLPLVDGGVSDSLPLAAFENMGYAKNIVILTRAENYKKHKNKLMPLIKIMYRDYPNLVMAMEKRHEVYNAELSYINKKAAAGKALVIRPSCQIDVSRIERDAKKIRKLYNLGRKDAAEQLCGIKAFLFQ